MTTGAGDCTLKATGGSYTFNFNTSTNKLIVIYNGNTKSVASVGADAVYKYGDADLNDVVNIKDATAIQKHAAALITLDGVALTLSDVTADNSVNVKDATAIQKFVAGLLAVFPAGDVYEENTVPNPPTEDIEAAYLQVEETLTRYYTYSSYDQYMALKNVHKSNSATAEELLALDTELKAAVEKIGGLVGDPTLGEITIYFENTKGWNTVYAYVWGSAGQPVAWPGTVLTNNGGNMYTVKVDYQLYQNIIFTNGSGAQTVDIDIIAKDNICYSITGGSDNALTVDTVGIAFAT